MIEALRVMTYIKLSLPTRNWDRALKFGDINVGVFKVVSRFISTFTPEELSVLVLLAEIIGVQVFYATKYAADDLFYRATHDEMTGLANRALFMDRLRSALLRANRDERPVGILMLDMDGLKNINDIFGHRAGDAALCAFAKRLKENIPGQLIPSPE